MWLLKTTMGTRWIEHKTNDVERRMMVNAITKRETKLIGHLLRYNQFITIAIMEGKVNGKRT